MSSYRPRTPPRSTFGDSSASSKGVSRGGQTQPVDNRATLVGSTYVPHLFDLVYPAGDAVSLSEKYIPPVFLEAESVDSSVLLGYGASFTASLQKIPTGPKTIEVTSHMPGWSTTKVKPAPPRPAYVVHKIARIAFDSNGEPLPQYRRAMQSVLTEFHALINPSLFKHPNVIRFLGIAWGSNPFSPLHRLPALVVEYAEHGTLSQVLASHDYLEYETKHLICLDVARGLSALHQTGLVHGDVKADNVLVFSSSSRKYLAKISDFGFSIVAATESSEVWMGGTDPWRAPEVKNGPVRLDSAMKTDVYSFGLLAWLISLNGQTPFDFIAERALQDKDVEMLKQNDALITEAGRGEWLLRYLKFRYGSTIEQYHNQALTRSFDRQLVPDSAHVQSMDLFPPKSLKPNLVAEIAHRVLQKPLMKSLDDIFQYSLSLDPEDRDLELIVLLLESSINTNESETISPHDNLKSNTQETTDTRYVIQNLSNETRSYVLNRETKPEGKVTDGLPKTDSSHEAPINVEKSENQKAESAQSPAYWSRRGFKKHWFSWQKTRDLQPSMQSLVFDSFTGSDSWEKAPELFMLCAYRTNGYGCRQDTGEALRILQRAAALEHHPSRALMYRIWNSCRPAETNPGAVYLETYAKAGSRPAFEDLKSSFPENEKERVWRWITDASGGVGADWLSTSEMLDGYTQSQWIKDDWLMDKIRSSQKPLSELIVNKRGDSVLHFVAMCGRYKPFKALILDYKMNIDLQNPLGETALLCASRSGHGGIMILCLQQYKANASLAAKNGETPLHWLIQFDDQYIQPIVTDLIARGANINAATRERVSHSIYPGTIDVDLLMPGTALTWAVHRNRPHIVETLLKHGAQLNITPGDSKLDALDMAAYYHHHECMKIIIEHLESKVTKTTSDGAIDKRYAFLMGPTVMGAEKAADKFSMILRGGADYLNRLHATLDLLRERSKFVSFQGQMQGSMLYSAVSKAHDEVVEYMFKNNWLTETINLPIGDARRTPVLEAIRWNRESLVQTLVDHGADILALAANPFAPEESNWSALHIYAHEGHDKDLSLVERLIEMGLPVEGPSKLDDPDVAQDSTPLPNIISTLSITDKSAFIQTNETPFVVAIRHNAFNLANTLLSFGADPNSLAISSGLFSTCYPLTALGHIVTANARYCYARLDYLLNLPEKHNISFIVEPTRRLTALHKCAMAHQEVAKRTDGGALVSRQEFDKDTNADIMYELLRKWCQPEELNAKCDIDGNTALHLAVAAQNIGTMQHLLDAGADTTIENEHGETPLQLVGKSAERTAEDREVEVTLARYAR
ncbi:MAG: hypothetical protein Q9195_005299 [Heterodermia aff. obscurata]